MKKIQKYQGLRGIAIISIVISHIFPKFSYAGAFGVSVFIGLSGFLTVLNCESVNRVKYDCKWYIRKLLKIYPLYLAVTLITSTYFSPAIVYGVDGKVNNFAFLMNIFMIQTYSSNAVYWGAFSQVGWYIPFVFLSIVITPIFLRFIRKIDSYIAFVLLVVIIYLEFIVCLLASDFDATSMRWFIYLFPPFRILEFVAGGCIAIILRDKLESSKKTYISDLSVIGELAFVLYLIKMSVDAGGLSFLNAVWILPVWGILSSLGRSNSKIIGLLFENPFISFIGDISFEIFLCHLCIYHYCLIWFSSFSSLHVVYYLAIFVTIVVVSVLVHWLNIKINSIVYNLLYKKYNGCEVR